MGKCKYEEISQCTCSKCEWNPYTHDTNVDNLNYVGPKCRGCNDCSFPYNIEFVRNCHCYKEEN